MTINQEIEQLTQKLDSLEKTVIVARLNHIAAAVERAREHRITMITLIGDNAGIYMPGIYSAAVELSRQTQANVVQETERMLQKLTLPTERFLTQFRKFKLEVAKSNIPNLIILKPYQQRKFHTVPGSRQDKYSRSKR